MTGRIPVAVLGAGGYIGQHFVRLLADHPDFELRVLTGGPRSTHLRLRELWRISEEPPSSVGDAKLASASPAALERAGVRLVFIALPSGAAGAVEEELTRRGLHVFSNASDHRGDRDVPLLVPEVNAPHLLALRRKGRAVWVTNPNCTATGLVLALAPVWRSLDPRAVHVTTYQALSGAGIPGVASLEATDNVIPFIAGEEEKVVRESRRILGELRGRSVRSSQVPFVVQCARVPVRDGHLEAVTLETSGPVRTEELLDRWREFDPLVGLDLPTAPHPPVVVRTEGDRPQPLLDRWAGSPPRARGMAVSVGRVRWDPPYLRFFLLSHNAVRGGAGGSVLNAELARAHGYFDGEPGASG
jgi:aspartate-semialdehyde dehydrogenase